MTDKRVQIDEFLGYGGNELFSSLMHSNLQRSEGIDRLVQLLQMYSDSCRHIKGMSAAYRFMLRKAVRKNWLGSGSKDLKSHRLTCEEREYITNKLDEYISSGGRNLRIAKKLLIIGVVILAAGLFAFVTIREFQRSLGQVSLLTTAYIDCHMECDNYL